MDRIILITGSTDGFGYYAAIEVAKIGYHVIVHGRIQEKLWKKTEKIVGMKFNDMI